MKKKRMSVLTVLLSLCAATIAQGLKDVYKDYFLIGVAVNQRNVTNAEQQALIKREFSSMTAGMTAAAMSTGVNKNMVHFLSAAGRSESQAVIYKDDVDAAFVP